MNLYLMTTYYILVICLINLKNTHINMKAVVPNESSYNNAQPHI
ncbi:hypothetical protein [Plasmodium yoelii yoelii]|uniref:Uncharacterized protein n=1 Tax=Plasmodium yoelii yoelii TaxID=73239 RepID=Q7RGB9_PLAYO|nr:hypothetical protein [Plasmodium yoelii yoelii]